MGADPTKATLLSIPCIPLTIYVNSSTLPFHPLTADQSNQHPKTPKKDTPARHIGHLPSHFITGFSHAATDKPTFFASPSFHGSNGARSDRESIPSSSILSLTSNNCFTEPVKKIHGRRTEPITARIAALLALRNA